MNQERNAHNPNEAGAGPVPGDPWSRLDMTMTGESGDLVRIGLPGQVDGTTKFFRHTAPMKRLIAHLKKQTLPAHSKILVAPCSVGCEAYSFAILAQEEGLFEHHPTLVIEGLDLQPAFIDAARTGHVPLRFLQTMPQRYHAYFAQTAHRTDRHEPLFSVRDDIRARVRFLPAQSLLDVKPANGLAYEAASCFCLFEHLEPRQAETMLAHLLKISRRLVCDDALYFELDSLRTAFRSVSKDARFFTLDKSGTPQTATNWDGSDRDLYAFQRHRLLINDMLICRLS
jgi:hypothetical protein